MTHKFYQKSSLVVIKDDSGERLFKSERYKNKDKLVASEFIKGAQKFIKVYDEHNLIITPDGLYTLNGDLIECGCFAYVETKQYGNTLLLIFKHSYTDERIDMVYLWDKKQIVWRCAPKKILYTDKYIAVYHETWGVYDTAGNRLLFNGKLSSEIRICGDLIISDMVGCHDVYSLKTGETIMQNQQIVKASTTQDFAIGLNLQRVATLWYEGKILKLDEVVLVDIIDEIEMFCIKHQNFGDVTVFKYCALFSALNENLMFTSVKMISFDKDAKQLMINLGHSVLFYKVDENKKLHLISKQF